VSPPGPNWISTYAVSEAMRADVNRIPLSPGPGGSSRDQLTYLAISFVRDGTNRLFTYTPANPPAFPLDSGLKTYFAAANITGDSAGSFASSKRTSRFAAGDGVALGLPPQEATTATSRIRDLTIDLRRCRLYPLNGFCRGA
jgi:hypothetical protein